MTERVNPYEREECPGCYGSGIDYSDGGGFECEKCGGSRWVFTAAAIEAQQRPGVRDLEQLLEPTEARVAELRLLPYREYLWTPEWRERRAMHIRMADYTCDRCGIRTRRYGALHVHHKTYERFGREERHDLEVLCATCHHKHHGITE